MYVPPHFAEQRLDVLRQLIHDYPLGMLVTLGEEGLNANHIPFEFDSIPAPLGTLRGHVARANPVWRDFSQTVDTLVVFLGPQSYITPSWYSTKSESGEVVPTYNYLAVHAYGSLQIRHEAEWLRGLVTRLTHRFESQRATPLPRSFVECFAVTRIQLRHGERCAWRRFCTEALRIGQRILQSPLQSFP